LEGIVSINSVIGRPIGDSLNKWSSRLVGISLLILLPVDAVRADGQQFCAAFCGARDQLQNTTMTPIRQLEGDALFQSAAAMRERVMTTEQRLLNQFWLHETAATRIQGGRVWSRLLRYSLTQLRHSKPSTDKRLKDLLNHDSLSTNNGDYQLRLSDDNIRLVVHYSF
jgi:hypothetical protein